MFTNRSLEAVSFNSQSSTTNLQQSVNVQTTEIVYNQNSAQTTETRSVETQTMVEEKIKPEVDYEKLAQFLNKVTPGVLEALDESYGTNAFENYDTNVTEDVPTQTHLLQKIYSTNDPDSQMKVSDISWSIGGGTLAVIYGMSYHRAWCNHESQILIFNETKQGSFTSTPSKTLETNACVTTVCYHPTEPSIIAAGLFDGDVLVWNLRDDESVPVVVCTHSDALSQVYWKAGTTNDVSLLVSASADGYIFSHKMVANFKVANIFKKFKIEKEHNPVERLKQGSAGRTWQRSIGGGLCITTFDFAFKDSTIFIVGTICGGVYKCSLDSVAPIEGDETLIDPVIGEFERHEGSSVTCIKCSPNRNLFITAGTDKEIHIYDFIEYTYLRVIYREFTIVGLTWMIGNQDVFATYGAGPDIELHHIVDRNFDSNIKFEPTDRRHTSCLRVNSKKDLVAIGDTDGNIEIWKIPRQLL